MKLAMHLEGEFVDVEINESSVTFSVPLAGAAERTKGYEAGEGATFDPADVLRDALITINEAFLETFGH